MQQRVRKLAVELHRAGHGAPVRDRVNRAGSWALDRQRSAGRNGAPLVMPVIVSVAPETETPPGFEIVYVPHIGKPLVEHGESERGAMTWTGVATPEPSRYAPGTIAAAVEYIVSGPKELL